MTIFCQKYVYCLQLYVIVWVIIEMNVIEFMGMPRAGKTTALEIMESYLKTFGARVRTVYEGARICPLDKSDRFN